MYPHVGSSTLLANIFKGQAQIQDGCVMAYSETFPNGIQGVCAQDHVVCPLGNMPGSLFAWAILRSFYRLSLTSAGRRRAAQGPHPAECSSVALSSPTKPYQVLARSGWFSLLTMAGQVPPRNPLVPW